MNKQTYNVSQDKMVVRILVNIRGRKAGSREGQGYGDKLDGAASQKQRKERASCIFSTAPRRWYMEI